MAADSGLASSPFFTEVLNVEGFLEILAQREGMSLRREIGKSGASFRRPPALQGASRGGAEP